MQRRTFSRMHTRVFFPRMCCVVYEKHDKQEPGFCDIGFYCIEMFVNAARRIAAKKGGKFQIEQQRIQLLNTAIGIGRRSKYNKGLDEPVNLKLTNCGFE